MLYSHLFLLFASDQDLYPSDDNELMLVECPAVILIFIIAAVPCMYILKRESVCVWVFSLHVASSAEYLYLKMYTLY